MEPESQLPCGVLNPNLHMCHFGDLGQHLPECWTGCTPRPRKKVYPTAKGASYLSPASALVSQGDQSTEVVPSWYLWSLDELATMILPNSVSVGSQTATPPRFCCANSAHRWELSHPALLPVLLLPVGGKGEKPRGSEIFLCQEEGIFPGAGGWQCCRKAALPRRLL